MFGITLILTGIAFALNGVVALCNWDRKGLATINTLVGLFLVITNTYFLTVSTSETNTIVYFGELLFGITLLFMASDIIWGGDKRALGWFSIMVAVCAITIALYFILTDVVFLGVLWAIWSLIWVFMFAGFGTGAKFTRSTYYCFVFQGVVALLAIGFLELMDVINVLA